MFARSVAMLGAVIMFAGVSGTDAQAFGSRHGCCQPKVCLKKVVTPPVYRTEMVQVMVRPASCTDIHTPPVYGVQPQRVVLQPERQVARSAPPVWGRERVSEMVRPGYTKWKRKRGCCGVEYACAVNVPPRYRTRNRRVQIQPASHWVETRPAVTGVINRRVMVSPGSVRKQCHPAVYKTVARQVMVSPGSEQWVPVARGGRCRR